ncbi:hypothetical protein [Laspinema olomoucense]|uniref:Uncharacterized protein n=1 Tax=Laspinema olomoucense D3b TaxID=2953688 RepID=A0ABT2NA43_9CYAN|nr:MULTISPECIES: hypothetical protein [unclassified Laspinema]MCT7970699.1 hypothetical protein [Laspinema sp. D3d]MCT7979567.1 hypothetical protein [Laspinema sp. D3b]MCT7987722.1 hypothetical protein [Laspinema sp. D3a]
MSFVICHLSLGDGGDRHRDRHRDGVDGGFALLLIALPVPSPVSWGGLGWGLLEVAKPRHEERGWNSLNTAAIASHDCVRWR